MTLTTDDKTKLKNLGAVEKHAAVETEIHNLHRAINDGTLNRDAANISLERLTAMNGDAPDDKADKNPNPLTAPFTPSPPLAPSPSQV